MCIAYPALALCFFVGYFASEYERKSEISRKNDLVITGKVEIFAGRGSYGNKNPVIAVIDKGDEAKILDFYDEGCSIGGIEVELKDGQTGYIIYYRSKSNYEIIRKGN